MLTEAEFEEATSFPVHSGRVRRLVEHDRAQRAEAVEDRDRNAALWEEQRAEIERLNTRLSAALASNAEKYLAALVELVDGLSLNTPIGLNRYKEIRAIVEEARRG